MIRTRSPCLDSVAVCSLLRHLYPFNNVDEDSVKQLPGYEDRNFYFKGYLEVDSTKGDLKPQITSPPDISCYDEFIFKVSHITNSFEVLQGVNEVMDHLKCKGFHCSYAIRSCSGEKITLLSENQLIRGDPNVRTGRGAQYPVRVLKYVSGEILQTVQLTPNLVYRIGELAGNIDKALLDFSHPELMHRTFSCPLWDLRNFSQIKTIASFNGMDQCQRTILETTVANFETFVQPLLPSFSQGILHNDINIQNIVREYNNEGEQCTLGIIDFGDCMLNCHLFELTIAVHGFLSHASFADEDRAVDATAPLVAGYMHTFPLSNVELGCLYYAVLARMCVTAVATEMNRQADPTNSYLGDLVQQSWRAAEVFYKHSKQEVDKIWTDAIRKPRDYSSLHN